MHILIQHVRDLTFHGLAMVLTVAGLSACAQQGEPLSADVEGTPIMATPNMMTPAAGDQTEHPVKPAWVWGEANLPAGFPPPGPVDEIVIKQYPAYRAAVKLADSPGGGEQNEMFWPLFQHIKKHDIAMTAPVEMTYETPQASTSDEVSPRIRAMAFMYAKPDMGTPGPDEAVVVTDLPAMTVLSIGVRGSYSDEHFQMALTQLQNWMLENPGRLIQAGPPRYLGYNSPFVPWFLRYGEVQLPVTLVESGQGSAPQ